MVPVRRALRLVIDRKAEIVEADGSVVRSERLQIPRPAVIRLVKFVHVPRRFRRQVTNTFLFARDNYRCQFCGRSQQELRHRECLTRDHLVRSEEHTSELQSLAYLVCRLLLEKKKRITMSPNSHTTQ